MMAAVHFLWALVWCTLLVIAFAGWGHLLLRLLLARAPSFGLAACVGLSLSVLLGGIFNLVHLIMGWVLICYTLIGLALALGQFFQPKREAIMPEATVIEPSWGLSLIFQRVVLIGFLSLLIFRIASTPRVESYNPEDDSMFYLPVVQKMTAMHHLAADPYSARRIESSLGGGYFLQGLVLACLPLDNIQMADRYIGLILMVLVAVRLARNFALSRTETFLFLLFLISIPAMGLNLTFNVLPTALILAMILAATERAYFLERPGLQALLIGLMAGTICCLKSTYLPHAVVFCVALYFLRGLEKGWRYTLNGWAFVAIGAVLVLAPWMIAMRMDSGTFFYPIFGPGYDFAAYHQFPTPNQVKPADIFRLGAIYFLPLGGYIFTQAVLLRRGEGKSAFLALALAGLLGTLATALATGGDSVQRYSFPIVFPALVLSYLQFASEVRLRPGWRAGYLLQGCGIVLLVMWTKSHFDHLEYAHMLHDVRASMADQPLDRPETTEEYARLNDAMPKDGVVLATLQHPYLLHLDEHILLADWPGCASLPPGWPIKQDGEALAKYLQGHSIRYIAYNYEDNQIIYDYLHPEKFPFLSLWQQVQQRSFMLAAGQYLELKQSRRMVYDDGKVFVLDLSQRIAGR